MLHLNTPKAKEDRRYILKPVPPLRIREENLFMKNCMQKITRVVLSLAVSCGMMTAAMTPALATEQTKEAEPTVTISSPSTTIYAYEPIEFTITAANLDPAETYNLELVGEFYDYGDEDTGSDITITGVTSYTWTLYPSFYYIDEYVNSQTYAYAVLQNYEQGGWWTSQKIYFTILEKPSCSLNLSWNNPTQLTTGTDYPFSVTVTNNSDQDISGLQLLSCVPTNLLDNNWTETIQYTLSDGMSIDASSSAKVNLPTLKAGESITVNATVNFPANAAGDTSHMSVTLYQAADGQEPEAIASTSSDLNNEFVISAPAAQDTTDTATADTASADNTSAGSTSTSQTTSPKTGDPVPFGGIMAAIILAALATAAVTKKKKI